MDIKVTRMVTKVTKVEAERAALSKKGRAAFLTASVVGTWGEPCKGVPGVGRFFVQTGRGASLHLE